MITRPSALILQADKVLLFRYSYNGHNVFALPGGNPEPLETLEDTLVRELKEELGIEIRIKHLVLAGEVVTDNPVKSILHCVFLTEIKSGSPVLNPNETTALEYKWISIEETVNLNLYPNIGINLVALHSKGFLSQNAYVGQIRQNWF